MIRGDHQYQITKRRAAEFDQALREALAMEECDARLHLATIQGLASQGETLKREMREYESRHRVRVFSAWYDLWIGAYYDRERRMLYICPLPTIVVQIKL